MKRQLLFVAILLTVLPSLLQAQNTARYQWPGHEIRNEALWLKFHNTLNTVNNTNTIYLLNVGAWEDGDPNCFFNTGGHWGVEGSLYEIGTPLYLEYTSGNYGNYQHARILISPEMINTKENHVAWIRGGVGTDQDGVISDRKIASEEIKNGITAVSEWYFYQATDVNTYWICYQDGTKWYYLKRKDSSAGVRKNVLEVTQLANTQEAKNNKYCQWRIVTKQDLINRFGQAVVSYKDIADATFYIYDQGLKRRDGHASKWNLQPGTGTVKIDNALGIGDDGGSPNYTVQNNGIDTQYTTVPAGQKTYYQLLYGQFFNGEIKGGTGSITQTTTDLITRGGWYMVTCQGFYKPGDGSTKQNAYLYAKVNDISNVTKGSEYWREAKLPLISSLPSQPTDLTESGMKFYENSENYSAKVIVWIPGEQQGSPGQHLELGVRLDESTGAGDWVAVDNFQLKYLGNDFLISEHAKNESFNSEWSARNYETMVLERQFVLGEWNSLSLPVDLNKDQVFTAFGTDVQLAELEKLSDDGKTIHFKTIDLNGKAWEDQAIGHNKAYLIKTNVEGISVNMDWKVAGYNDDGLTNNYRTTSPLYIMQAVSFNQNLVSEMPETKTNAFNGQSLTINPVIYWKDGVTNPKVQGRTDNYTYAMNKGKLTRYQREFPLKGLRWWLEFKEAPQSGISVEFRSADDEEVSGIQVIGSNAEPTAPRGIYTIDGRRMAGGNVSSLPNGTYIVDGRKVTVYQ